MFSPLLHLFIPSLFNLSLSSSLHLFISPSLPNPCSSSLLFKFFSSSLSRKQPLLLLFSVESNPCSSSLLFEFFFSLSLSRKQPLLLLFSTESNPCSSSKLFILFSLNLSPSHPKTTCISSPVKATSFICFLIFWYESQMGESPISASLLP